MKKRQIEESEKDLFAEVSTLKSQGYCDDLITIEKVMIEVHQCPQCLKPLVYKGFENLIETRSYGICEECRYARFFFRFDSPISDFTRKVCRSAQKAV